MLLKILLLQVMSSGLITVPIKAQDSYVELPDLYMRDHDKAVMNSIWNMAGFPSDQDGASDVDRKFFSTLGQVVPVVKHVPIGPGTINAIGPGYRSSMSPSYASGVADGYPSVMPVMPYPQQQQYNDIKQDKQRHQARGSYIRSPTPINYKVLPKPPNSELESSEENYVPGLTSNRRALHPENAHLELTDDNDKENQALYYSTKNLQTDLGSADLVMERMMQFEGPDDNIHTNNKPRNFLRKKSNQKINGDVQSHGTNSRTKTRKNNNPPDEENGTMKRNSRTGVHKKKRNRKTGNTSRNSETSTHLPTVASQKSSRKWKESTRKSNKTSATRKYYDMLENNQKYLCKCDIMSDETMKGSKSRRRNPELNDRNSYTEQSMDIRHERPFNCTKYCSVAEKNADKTKDKDNLRMRRRPGKGVFHKDKRNNVDDDAAEKGSVEPKATHSRNYRNKHSMNSYMDDTNYRPMRNVNPSEYVAGSPAEVLDNIAGYNSVMQQYPKSNLIHYDPRKML